MTILAILLLFLGYRLVKAERACAAAKTQQEISALYLRIERILSTPGFDERNCLSQIIQPTLLAYMNDPLTISYRGAFSKERRTFTDSLLKDVHSLPESQKKVAIESIVTLGWTTVRNHAILAIAFWTVVAAAFLSVVLSKGIRYLFESSSKLFKDSEIRFGAQRITCHGY